MKKLILSFLFIFMFLPVFAIEQIHSFDSVIRVNNDGSASITETITVNAEHVNIRRGIYRSIITSVKQRPSESITISNVRLKKDGLPHPFSISSSGRNTRIDFGDDNYINKGVHTYTLDYTAGNAVREFKDYDEIYWNITGNDWSFPILKASVKVQPPFGAQVNSNRISLYTGTYGSQKSNAVRTGELEYQTTRVLRPGDGMTIAIPWNKGFIEKPSFKEQCSKNGILHCVKMYIFSGSWTVNLFIIIPMLIYYLLIWLHVGKDPKKRVVRQYAPPKDMSPAFVRYVYKMGFDTITFTSAIINLCIKGAITIERRGEGKSKLKKFLLGNPFVIVLKDSEVEGISEEEKALLSRLFSTKRAGAAVELTDKRQTTIKATMDKTKDALKNMERSRFFTHNYLWNLPSIVAFVLLTLISSPVERAIENGSIMIFIVVFFSFGIQAVKQKNILFLVMFICFALPPILASNTLMGIIPLCIFIAVALVFYYLVKAYTHEGRMVMDEIEGFRQYLSVAEKHRGYESVPTDKEQIYCDYLPYAIALDVENKWTKRFEKELSKTILEEVRAKHGLIALQAASIAGLTNAISTSSSPKGGGSGSGGGGFSGGGSGGGGGGGR